MIVDAFLAMAASVTLIGMAAYALLWLVIEVAKRVVARRWRGEVRDEN